MTVLLALVGLLVVVLLVGVHVYVWRRLVRDTTRPSGTSRRLMTAALLAGPVCALATIVAQATDAPFRLRQVLAWPGYLWLAFLLYAVLTLLVADLLRLLLSVAQRVAARRDPSDDVPAASPSQVSTAAAPKEAAAVTRRQFVARAVATTAVGISTATVAHGTYGVLRGPRVAHLTVPLAKLSRAGHGFRIAVVSDIHLGPTLGRSFAQKVVDAVNGTQPDLIAVVGDLVDGDVDDLARATAPLARLEARHGAYFVTGNHEYISGVEQWIDHLQELGLRPLQNTRTELPAFDLAGVNDELGDRYGQAPDYDRALGDRDLSRPAVLMAHQPVQVHEAQRHGVDLQLSGHTHGGQLWPGSLLAGLVNPTVAGLERYGDTQLFVSRGAGAWGPPTRVGAPSDITVVELASPDA
ncbi:metallophosphoesterase [Nocardioides alcanivorans]|uniref:metallophosphoesterase n=1 Tax=Nocardioides alcanivorans TaxID=2897352 RepID=UPI001F22DB83|nr:metallophosphoesterase [Nocardioides alcanivorans]